MVHLSIYPALANTKFATKGFALILDAVRGLEMRLLLACRKQKGQLKFKVDEYDVERLLSVLHRAGFASVFSNHLSLFLGT